MGFFQFYSWICVSSEVLDILWYNFFFLYFVEICHRYFRVFYRSYNESLLTLVYKSLMVLVSLYSAQCWELSIFYIDVHCNWGVELPDVALYSLPNFARKFLQGLRCILCILSTKFLEAFEVKYLTWKSFKQHLLEIKFSFKDFFIRLVYVRRLTV